MANPPHSTSPVQTDGLVSGSTCSRRPGPRPTARGRIIGIAATAASALAAVSVTACSKTEAPTVATVVTRDNAICKTYAERIAKIATPTFDAANATGANLPAAAKYLDQFVPLMEAEQREINSVGTPNASKDLYASVLVALAAVIGDEQAARAAAHAGDLHAFQTAYRADANDAIRLSGVAQQFGLTACLAG